MHKIENTHEALAMAVGAGLPGDGDELDVFYVSASEVKIGDLLGGYWVTGITLGRHDGQKAYTFQLGSPLTPHGELTRGRLTLVDSKDDGVIIVRMKEEVEQELKAAASA